MPPVSSVTPLHWRIWLLAAGQMTAWGVLFYSFGVLLPSMEKDLGVPRSWLTAAFTLSSLVAGAVSASVGRWLDRSGSRRVMGIGGVFTLLVTLGWSAVPSFTMFILVMVLAGVAQALVLYEPAFAGLTRWFPEAPRRTKALLLVTFFGGLSSTVFMPLTAWLVTARGWHGAVLGLAVVFAVVALPAFFLLPPHPDLAPVNAPAPEAAALPSAPPGFGWLTAAFCAQSFLVGVISVHLTPLLLEAGGRTPERAATLAGLFGIFQVAARLGVGPWIGRIPGARRVALILALHVVAGGLLLRAGSDVAAVAFAIAYGVANGLVTIVRPIVVAEWMGVASFGAANGLMAAWTLPFRALAPFLLGVLHDVGGGYLPVILVLIACPAAGLFAALRAQSCHRGRSALPPAPRGGLILFPNQPMPRPPFQVLILCTGNSARSIFGEYLLRKHGAGRFEVASAGARPSGHVHPLSRWVLERHFGIDASGARSKSWAEFEGRRFDFVITVCDNAREACPVFPGQPITAHWGSPDPAAFEGTEGEQKQFFLRVAQQIERRVELFCSFPDDKLDALTVRSIGEQHRLEDEDAHAR